MKLNTYQKNIIKKNYEKMKKYTVQIEIEEGNDEFWEEITDYNKRSGCDELIEGLKIDLSNWQNIEIKLIKFEDK